MKTFFLILFCLCSTAISAQTYPQGKAGSVAFEQYEIVSNSGLKVSAELGKLLVSENRTTPNGHLLELAFVRLKSTAKNPCPPIVYLAGGPGASAIKGTLTGERLSVFLALRELGDVIILDQRGTGMSKPDISTAQPLGVPLDKTLDSPEAQKILLDNARAFATSLKEKGIDLAAYNTAENAEDVNDLRLALGVQKINLWGHSYGSHLGLAILKRHGNTIHRAALSGVNGLDQRYRFPTDADTIFKRIDNLIAQNAKLRAAIPDFSALVKQVIENLRQKPVIAEATVRGKKASVGIGSLDVQVMTALMLGEKTFIYELPSLYYAMSKGDYSRAAELIATVIKMRPMGTAMSYTMHCASGASTARLQMVKERTATATLGNAINFPFSLPEFSDVWGAKDLGEEFRAPMLADVPTLLMSSTLDGRTSIADAEEVRKGLKNSTHVIFDNIAHDLDVPQASETLSSFFAEKPITQTRITIPNFEFYSLNTSAMVSALYTTMTQKGAQAFEQEFTQLTNSETYINSTLTLLLGYRFLREKKAQEAIAVWELNNRIFPNRWQIHNALGDAYSMAGNKEQALRSYRQSLELYPFNMSAQVNLAKLQ